MANCSYNSYKWSDFTLLITGFWANLVVSGSVRDPSSHAFVYCRCQSDAFKSTPTCEVEVQHRHLLIPSPCEKKQFTPTWKTLKIDAVQNKYGMDMDMYGVLTVHMIIWKMIWTVFDMTYFNYFIYVPGSKPVILGMEKSHL